MPTHVFDTMGTVASLKFRAPLPRTAVLTEVEAVFADADARFSLYRNSSDLSRIGRGDLHLLNASEELRDTYALALKWRDATGGAFTPHRPDGRIDLSGVVKATTIAQAALLLTEAGAGDWLLTVGGDAVAHIEDGGPAWNAGIIDESDRTRLLTTVPLGYPRRAIATSGTAERGEHIWRRMPGQQNFVQVTVLAADIVTADVWATAILAGGPDTLERATSTADVDVLCCDQVGDLLVTPALRESILRR